MDGSMGVAGHPVEGASEAQCLLWCCLPEKANGRGGGGGSNGALCWLETSRDKRISLEGWPSIKVTGSAGYLQVPSGWT